jgi:hypothetical protein
MDDFEAPNPPLSEESADLFLRCRLAMIAAFLLALLAAALVQRARGDSRLPGPVVRHIAVHVGIVEGPG